ncbi:MAG: peptidoglycan editing factor PgeF [Xanthomonadales bacterium]|nr:peptidoglycan editing factor PgeF [Xanthomonadales bacterium]
MAERDDWLLPDWPVPAPVQAVATLRCSPGRSAAPFGPCNLGSRCGDLGEDVAANRALLADALRLPSTPVWLQQVHGSQVHVAQAPAQRGAGPREEPVADAAVSREPGVVLAVLTADCLPVLLADRAGTVVGAAHAGWRGLAAGVLENTVAAMACDPAGLVAWLGAAIGARNYEVDATVRDAFLAVDEGAATAFQATRPGHWTCDLYGLARRRLATAGVTGVHGGGLCTYADPARFHSFRRDGANSGRQATLVWLANRD